MLTQVNFSMNKKLAVLIVVAVAAAVSVYTFWPERGAEQTKLFGNVDIRQVSLSFTQSERVTAVNVEEGDVVKAGQIIARLDDTVANLELAQANAQIAAQEALVAKLQAGSRPQEIAQAKAVVAQQQANVNIASARLKRLQSVDSKTQGKGVSQQDIDEAGDQVAALQATLAQGKASLALVEEGPRKEDIDQARAQLQVLTSQQALLAEQVSRTVLLAPSDGEVRARLMEPGDLATPQRPVITLALTSPKWIRVYINETQLATTRVGEAVDVHVDGLNKTIKGTISFISSVAEFTPKNVQTEDLRTSLVYEVRVRVDDADNTLKLGMPATVMLVNNGR